ncbi:hypothetical protein OsJ_00713 [Oryza sativa Japonica Group]|uniref:HMA domain-containing protein n=1 Tax=Oryza sativa subsp. japonica TaxID=39947 RepID=B9ETL4_ORYSJ|nr:hypothetical protein OsJ_00713 [Oryza sativa Japonica Group]
MVGSKQASREEDGGQDGKLELTDSNPLSLASVFSPAVSSPYSPSPCSCLREEGVLRTEINPSLDKVTVVGDVDSRVLVQKLSKVGKIAEVMAPPPPSPAAPSEEGKKSNSNGGEKPTSPADEKSARKDEGKDGKGNKSPATAAACKQECSKCTARKEAATRADEAGRAGGKTASSKDATTKSSGDGDKSEPAAVAVEYQYHHHYNWAEPAMVVPVSETVNSAVKQWLLPGKSRCIERNA